MLLDGGTKGEKGIHEFTTTTSLELDITKHIKLNADYTYSFYIADDWYRSTVATYSIQPGIIQEVPNYNTDQLKKQCGLIQCMSLMYMRIIIKHLENIL